MSSPRYTVTRKFSFDAGHRVTLHESKCKNVHGHTYIVEFTIWANSLDPVGRVVDFGRIKEEIVAWVDQYLDHGYIANQTDTGMIDLLQKTGQKLFVMPCEPTAENIARLLYKKGEELFGKRNIQNVRVWETPNCCADYAEVDF